MTFVAVSRVPRHGTARMSPALGGCTEHSHCSLLEVLIRAGEEGVVKKSHREAGVEVFDGLVRGVLASAALKTLATESIASLGRALKENTLKTS